MIKNVLILAVMLLTFISFGCSKGQDENEKIIQLQAELNKKETEISTLREKIGELKEIKGQGKAYCWEEYKIYIYTLMFLIIASFYLAFKFKETERRKCDSEKEELKEKNEDLQELLMKRKEEISSMQSEIKRLKEELEHDEKNEIVGMIKNIRESRKVRINKLNNSKVEE